MSEAVRGKPLGVLLVDDEDLARLRLKSLLQQIDDPPSVVVGEAADAAEAVSFLSSGACDLVFLDIQMPGRTGTELAMELRRLDRPPAVVFVTAHSEHAVTAFDLDAVDYVTKPVGKDRLQAALRRAAQRLAARPELPPSTPPKTTGTMAPELLITDRGRVHKVLVSEVLYCKAELKYVTLRTATGTFLLDDSLSDLEHRLGPGFLRVHRNALVALWAVRALERRPLPGEKEEDGGESWAVRVTQVDEWLAVSRRQVGAVREALRAGRA